MPMGRAAVAVACGLAAFHIAYLHGADTDKADILQLLLEFGVALLQLFQRRRVGFRIFSFFLRIVLALDSSMVCTCSSPQVSSVNRAAERT
jgi:hypothetical protein